MNARDPQRTTGAVAAEPGPDVGAFLAAPIGCGVVAVDGGRRRPVTGVWYDDAANEVVVDLEVSGAACCSGRAAVTWPTLTAQARRRVVAGIHLTDRERQILTLIADGLTYEQVAGRLFLARSTVRIAMTSVLRKLQANNSAHAVAIGYQTCILGGPEATGAGDG